ncbi:MAG: hypothetical protein ACQES0_10965 [Bacteroidota bacterium]
MKEITKKKWKFILTRGLLMIGLGLLVFFHLFQWYTSELNFISYIQSLDKQELYLESASMLLSGLFLGWFIWRQQKKLRNFKN